MCEYCEKHEDDIPEFLVDCNIPLGIMGDASLLITLRDRGDDLFLSCTVQGAMGAKPSYIAREVIINYCPMCGRKFIRRMRK
jgi:hypothetical protein